MKLWKQKNKKVKLRTYIFCFPDARVWGKHAATEERPEIEIVELEFVEGNDRARALYEKYVFKIVSERPNAFKLKDGRLLKEYFMQKELKKK